MLNLDLARLFTGTLVGAILLAACEFDDSQDVTHADASVGTTGETTTGAATSTDLTTSTTTTDSTTVTSGPTGSGGEGGASGSGGEAGSGGSSGSGGEAGNGGSGGVAQDAGPATTIDDSIVGTGPNQFNYMGVWNQCPKVTCNTPATPDLYNKTNHWAGGTDAGSGQTVTLSFSGTQLLFYGVKDTRYGIGAVSMDNGTETTIDYYSTTRMGDQLMWTSPALPSGNHTFKLRVTGMKNPSSTDSTITVDRVDVR